MALMGIDVGTAGVKCTITDNAGLFLSADYEEYLSSTPGEGLFELDPDVVWSSTMKVIRNAVKVLKEEIISVSVSSFGEAFVPIDKNGKTLFQSMVYTDKRGIEENKELCSIITKEEILERTGLSASSTYSLPKIMWIKKSKPEIYSEIWKILPFGSFILYKLGGIYAVDYTLAARTMAFNVEDKSWDTEILTAAGIDQTLLPKAYKMGTVVGTVSPEIAEELQISNKLKLVTGAHDQICAAIGSGVRNKGQAMDGMGSVNSICPVFDGNQINRDKYDSAYPIVPYLNDTFTTYAYIYDGGTLLRWYRDKFGQIEMNEAEEKGISVYDIFNENCYGKPTNLFVLPHLSGSATPFMDPVAKGAILGIDTHTDKNMIYRAILEGTAFELKLNLEKLEDGGVEIDTISVSGGGSRSEIWLQIKADIYNKPVLSLKNKEAGTLGVIIIAGVAAGIFPSFEEAMDKLVKTEKVFQPDLENVQYYRKQFKKYKRIYEAQKLVYAD